MRNKSNNKLEKTYKLAQNIFPGIGKVCAGCNTCCWTYGWLLSDEEKAFRKKGFPTAKINDCLSCIDSFNKNAGGKRVINKIPKCRFYWKRRCLIQKDKPLDCRLYPVKTKHHEDGSYIGLSLGCKYVSSLSENKLKAVCDNIVNFFGKIPKEIADEYFNLMYDVYLTSKPKRYWMKKIMEVKKTGKKWSIRPLVAH